MVGVAEGVDVRIAVGADHAGFLLKIELLELLGVEGHEALDLGTDSTDAVDYPDYAKAVGEEVASGRVERGLLVSVTLTRDKGDDRQGSIDLEPWWKVGGVEDL